MNRFSIILILLLLFTVNVYSQKSDSTYIIEAQTFLEKLDKRINEISLLSKAYAENTGKHKDKEKLKLIASNYNILHDSLVNYLVNLDAIKNKKDLKIILNEFCHSADEQAGIKRLINWSNNQHNYKTDNEIIEKMNQIYYQLNFYINSLKTENDYNDPVKMLDFQVWIENLINEKELINKLVKKIIIDSK